jgi:hypothetical protein
MKFYKILLALLFFTIATSCQKPSISDIVPEYKFLVEFSKKIKPRTELILRAYGINNSVSKNYEFSNDLATFELTYCLLKRKNDEIPLETARRLLVSVVEAFLIEVGSNSSIRTQLEVFPFVSDRVNVNICFRDQNYIELGQGIASVYLYKGKIRYERYDISEYTGQYPAKGKHFKIHEETYEEALKIVKEQGGPLKLIE